MKKIIAQVTAISIMASSVLAQDFYVIKPGDTLSRVVKRHFPSEKLYSSRGKLKEVLRLNPNIKNPNIIFPNQKIQFSPVKAYEPIETDSVKEVAVEEVQLESTIEVEHFPKHIISALYGMKYISITQTGALGKAEANVLFLNDVKLNSELIFKDWLFGLQFDTYKFKYKDLNSTNASQMYSLSFYTSYKWLLGGFNVEQNPIFRKNNANIEMNKMTLMTISLGISREFDLSASEPTKLMFKGWLDYPLNSLTENPDIKLSSVKGFGLMGQVELNRQIYSTDYYSLHATWLNQLGLRKMSQDVQWNTSKGEVTSNIINASTSVGMLLKF